jgi:hypothetical protein
MGKNALQKKIDVNVLSLIATQDLHLVNLMFSWPCIIVYQYSETNVMHFYSVY